MKLTFDFYWADSKKAGPEEEIHNTGRRFTVNPTEQKKNCCFYICRK